MNLSWRKPYLTSYIKNKKTYIGSTQVDLRGDQRSIDSD